MRPACDLVGVNPQFPAGWTANMGPLERVAGAGEGEGGAGGERAGGAAGVTGSQVRPVPE